MIHRFTTKKFTSRFERIKRIEITKINALTQHEATASFNGICSDPLSIINYTTVSVPTQVERISGLSPNFTFAPVNHRSYNIDVIKDLKYCINIVKCNPEDKEEIRGKPVNIITNHQQKKAVYGRV